MTALFGCRAFSHSLGRKQPSNGQEWSGVKVRVTEAWDEDDEHSGQALHYKARGPPTLPPRMSTLAFDAVLIGSGTRAHLHVHASVKA